MTRVGRRLAFALALALVVLSVVPSFVTAAPGDLDTSFGGDGTVLAQFDQPAGANAVVAQPDGSIVAAGTYSEAQFAQFALARWLADGTPDPGFSDDGQFNRQFAAGPGAANGVALQSDGAIVAAGAILDDQEGDGEFALLRLTAAGVPDDSFGVDGEVTTEFAGGDAQANAVTVLPDGTIVAVGELDMAPGSEFAIARYDVDGTLLWQTTTQFADGPARAADVVIEPDRIVAIGTVNTPSGSARFALAGYTLEGDLDPTFGNGGTQDTAFVGGGALGRGAVLASTGQILVAGDFTAATGNDRFALARYTADGQLDITFQTEGRTTTPFSQSNAFGADVVQEPCGGLVVGGLAFDFSFGHQAFALAGYGADGTLNPGFGTGGTQTTRFATDEGSGIALTLAPGDKPVIAGPITSSGDIQFGVARYEGSCVTPPPPPAPPRTAGAAGPAAAAGAHGAGQDQDDGRAPARRRDGPDRAAVPDRARRALSWGAQTAGAAAQRPVARQEGGRVHVARPCALLDCQGAARHRGPDGESPGAAGARGPAARGCARRGAHPPAERRDPDRRPWDPRAGRGGAGADLNPAELDAAGRAVNRR